MGNDLYWEAEPGSRPPKVVGTGRALGLAYAVVSDGCFPRAYIECPPMAEGLVPDLPVHGGPTYSGEGLPPRVASLRDWGGAFSGTVAGWDYGHLTDKVRGARDGSEWDLASVEMDVSAAARHLTLGAGIQYRGTED